MPQLVLLGWGLLAVGSLGVAGDTAEKIEKPLKWVVIGGGVYLAGKYLKAW